MWPVFVWNNGAPAAVVLRGSSRLVPRIAANRTLTQSADATLGVWLMLQFVLVGRLPPEGLLPLGGKGARPRAEPEISSESAPAEGPIRGHVTTASSWARES